MSFILRAFKDDLQSMVFDMGLKDVSGMNKISLKKTMIGVEDYEKEDIRGMPTVIKERRKVSDRTKLEEKKWK
ncbi:hypothetical protein NPIL_491 [Nephila pilipes]|uniref:Uncharacterized protein n=1 Tax=Nephila pilipes TaxID=299642 RepID=A0A8X6QZE3_NEPPI|nr:hypothetical protein NPIL_491 [Nephila pilipes]